MEQPAHLRLDLGPVGQELLDLPWPRFRQIVARARERTSARSAEELKYACQLLDWMLFKIAENTSPSRSPRDNSEKPKRNEPSLPFLAKHLHEHIGLFNIQDIPYLPNLSWAELFSVMAMALLQDAAEAYTGWAHLGETTIEPYLKTSPRFDQPYGAYGMDCLLAAAESLAYAHIHAETKPLAQSLAEQAISIRNQSAAITRHADTHRFKDEFYAFCKAQGFGNIQQAAREFIAANAERITKLGLSANYVPRMLAESVYARRKLENPSSNTSSEVDSVQK